MGLKNSKTLALLLGATLLLSACGDKEAEELERQQQIELEAQQKAEEMVEQYKEEADEKRVSPYSVSEMEEGFGSVYKNIRGQISEFNNDILKLRDGDITVYDINKKVSDYRIKHKEFEDVDTLKIPDDYYSFYDEFKDVSLEYIGNLEVFGSHYQAKDTLGIEEVSGLIASNLNTMYDLEFKIFGTPLGDKLLSGDSKERSDKRLKELCTISVDNSNQEYLDKIALPEVNKKDLSEEELLIRVEAEEEYIKLMEDYAETAKVERQECYDKFMQERSTFGNRVVESENAELESDLMEMLDSYNERQLEEEAAEVEDLEADPEASLEEDYDAEFSEEDLEDTEE